MTTPRASSVSQGPMFDSWSKAVTMTSSPGASWLAMAVARKRRLMVVVALSTISSGRSALISRAILARASPSLAAASSEAA